MIVCTFYFVTLVEQGRVKNEIYSLLDEPGNVTVSQLGRITFRFTGDGFYTKLVNLPV